jgi:hypothetical protein
MCSNQVRTTSSILCNNRAPSLKSIQAAVSVLTEISKRNNVAVFRSTLLAITFIDLVVNAIDTYLTIAGFARHWCSSRRLA